MDSSRILKGSLDIGRLAPAKKDSCILDFLGMIDCFRKNHVSICKEKGFDSHEYPYGTAHILFYLPWSETHTNKELDGISQNVYQMMSSSLTQYPGIGREIEDSDWDKKDEYKADFGLAVFNPVPNRYFTTSRDWHDGRANYYRSHQQEFEWPEISDLFLPNKSYSDSLLQSEIDRHRELAGYAQYIAELDGEPLHIRFHKGIMAHKGAGIAAYVEAIGTRICEANFYRHEAELSKAERALSHSPRKIFSMVNREGKRQFISLDFAHGMFEYIDPHGDHIGEYRLTGEFNSAAETDHGFKSDFKKYIK